MREIPFAAQKHKTLIAVGPSLQKREEKNWGLEKKSLEKELGDRYLVIPLTNEVEQTVTEEGEE